MAASVVGDPTLTAYSRGQLEKTVLALDPISRIVPTTITKITPE